MQAYINDRNFRLTLTGDYLTCDALDVKIYLLKYDTKEGMVEGSFDHCRCGSNC